MEKVPRSVQSMLIQDWNCIGSAEFLMLDKENRSRNIVNRRIWNNRINRLG